MDYFLDPPKLLFFGSGAPPRGSKSLIFMGPSCQSKCIRVLGPLGAPGGPILGPWRGHFGGLFGAPERHISHEDKSLKQGRRQILLDAGRGRKSIILRLSRVQHERREGEEMVKGMREDEEGSERKVCAFEL